MHCAKLCIFHFLRFRGGVIVHCGTFWTVLENRQISVGYAECTKSFRSLKHRQGAVQLHLLR